MSKDVFERDREFYQQRGIGNKMGFGKKPALVVIDLQLGFTDPNFPLGGDLDQVVASCRKLIDAAHAKKIPVWTLGDIFAPALALGHALGRLGCFFEGFCYGRTCSLP